jgi:hypothetical protein
MANSKTVLTLLAGAAFGAGLTYFAMESQAKAAPKKTGKKAPEIPEQPPGPGPGQAGPGTSGGYRPPSDASVTLPQGDEGLKELDATICSVVNAFEEEPEPVDVALATLDAWAPNVEWPAVSGDSQSIVALQAMVVFRVDQMATADPSKTPPENLIDACKAGLSQHPKEPEPATPHYQPPGG